MCRQFGPRATSQTDRQQEIVDAFIKVESDCKWKLGEWASKWKAETGLSDAKLAERADTTRAKVFFYRSVFEMFGARSPGSAPWSCYKEALNWDDANECIQWASENGATKREMIAWRKAKNGEPLTEEPKDDDDEAATGSEPLAGAHITKKSDSDSPLVTQNSAAKTTGKGKGSKAKDETPTDPPDDDEAESTQDAPDEPHRSVTTGATTQAHAVLEAIRWAATAPKGETCAAADTRTGL